MTDPLTRIVDRLVAETRESDWEMRFEMFSAAVQAVVEGANTDPEMAGAIYGQVHPKMIARRVVEGFGEVPVVSRYQAAIYFLSDNPRHKEMSVAWQRENQAEVLKLMAEMPSSN